VANAASFVDEQLAKDPLNAGESRGGKSRVVCEAPLAVFFVTVWGVNQHQ
jgi:hypothetical protein